MEGESDSQNNTKSIPRNFSSDDFSSDDSSANDSSDHDFLSEYEKLDFDFESFSVFDLAGTTVGKRMFRLLERIDRAKKLAKDKYQVLATKSKQEPKFVRLRDKASFVSGVTILMMTSFIMGRKPWLIPTWYTVLSCFLLPIRLYMYRKLQWHYFLFDFCYFANLLLLLFINFFPTSRMLFITCFSFSFGPLAWAVVAWRNSLVFHSLEKVTSNFIHIMPYIVCLVLRFQNNDPKFAMCRETQASFSEVVVFPFIPYFFWQALYYIKTEIISAKKIRDRNYMTSLRWLTSEESTAFYKKWMLKYGAKYSVFIFMGLQFLFHLLTSLPMKLYFDHYYLAIVFTSTITLVSIWNGAGFYFEVFSKDYMKKMQSLEQLQSASELRKSNQSAMNTKNE